MKCPHCDQGIDEGLLKKHFSSIGGKNSKRKITSEQQAKMQAGRKITKEDKDAKN